MDHDDAARPRILVVEDEWLIAAQLELTLEDLGYAVVGPAPSVREAVALIATDRPDAAVLDISLGDETSFAIAAALTERDIPFLFLSGYTAADLPAGLDGRILLNKPATERDLGDILAALLADR